MGQSETLPGRGFTRPGSGRKDSLMTSGANDSISALVADASAWARKVANDAVTWAVDLAAAEATLLSGEADAAREAAWRLNREIGWLARDARALKSRADALRRRAVNAVNPIARARIQGVVESVDAVLRSTVTPMQQKTARLARTATASDQGAETTDQTTNLTTDPTASESPNGRSSMMQMGLGATVGVGALLGVWAIARLWRGRG